MSLPKNLKVSFLLVILACSIVSATFALQSSVILSSTGSIRYQSRCAFGVIGSAEKNPAIRNFYWLFGNQSINYTALTPSEVSNFAVIHQFDGLVVWTRQNYRYNATAIKQFAKNHVVICDVKDFCNFLYPSLSNSTETVSTNTVTYDMDWGNFREGNLVEMRNETGNIDQLTTVLTSGLSSFSNVTIIAHYDDNRVAFFHMNGTRSKSGFYVMDLDATTPETEWAGIWHVFPAIKMVKDFPTGRYARWFAIGIDWPSVSWVHSWMTNFTNANSDIVTMRSIGMSVQGRPINALFIGKGSRYAIVDGSIHGNEKSTTFGCLRLAEAIVEDYRVGGYWSKRLEDYTIIIIPIVNPDGFAANNRYNANGADLNRQFPPDGTTTEPEAWALRWLMGNYTPTIYVNNHEGRHWQTNKIFYGPYQEAVQKNFSIVNIRCAIAAFAKLQHWGYYTDGGCNLWIGKVRGPFQGGSSYAIAYASWKHQASSMLVESFVWSSSYNGTNYKARQGLYAVDYYVCLALSFISHFDKLTEDNFTVYSDAKIESTVWSGQLCIEIDGSELTTSSLTKIYVGDRGKPVSVKIDGEERAEDDGWTFELGIITVTGASNLIEASWS
ncbi:MAG: M14 family zinc carboxypeptidase [Candidatus Baldrarchaeia archaeon]